jgi:hypothetical protein
MTRAEILFKCIELCSRHDKEPEQILARAKVFAEWISKEISASDEKAPAKIGRPKKADTADILG